MIIELSKAEMTALCSIPDKRDKRDALRYILIEYTTAPTLTLTVTDTHRALQLTSVVEPIDPPAADTAWFILPAQLKALTIARGQSLLLDTANIPAIDGLLYPDLTAIMAPPPDPLQALRCTGYSLQTAGAIGFNPVFFTPWQILSARMDMGETWFTVPREDKTGILRAECITSIYSAVYCVCQGVLPGNTDMHDATRAWLEGESNEGRSRW